MKYNETAEYAFDTIEHIYNYSVKDIIYRIGNTDIYLLLPTHYRELLKTVSGHSPIQYRGLDIVYTTVDRPIFAIKEKGNEIKV